MPALPDHDAEIAPDVVTTLFINSEWRRLISDAIQTYADSMIAYMPDAEIDVFRNKFQALLNDLYTAEPMDNLIGTMTAWLGEIADIPAKWLLCDGDLYNGADYPELYAVLADIFKDAFGNFRTPNIQDRFVLGSGINDDVGEIGGANEHTLTIAQMPAHTHTIAKSAGTASQTARAVIGNNTASTDQVSGSAGSGAAHNNMPAYLAVHYIIKALP